VNGRQSRIRPYRNPHERDSNTNLPQTSVAVLMDKRIDTANTDAAEDGAGLDERAAIVTK
jgi:hypothetical protein